MLGYVKCEPGELLVRQHALYRALYCGLCRSARKNLGFATTPFHSYDFVFYAAVRFLVFGEQYRVERRACPLHPLRRRPTAADHKILADTAFCQLLLIREKMRDDLADRDAPFFRKALCRLWLPFLNLEARSAMRCDPAKKDLAEKMTAAFAAGREKEKRGADLDEMCSDFADVLAALFSFGAEGNGARFLRGLGDKLGRFLYTLDALDDVEKDAKKGAFNPLLTRFGGVLGVREHLSEIDAVQLFYIREMDLILALLDGDRDLIAICENIVRRGLLKEEKRLIDQRKGISA